MNRETLRSYCLARPGTTEERPFGPETLVYKVMGKMFALTQDEPQPEFVNLKCDPDDALYFRSQFDGIRPGYHMSKKHWNSVYLDGSVPESLIRELIDDSYELVAASLKKADRDRLQALSSNYGED